MPVHHFTVDVEEYFQVSAFESIIPRSEWETRTPRLEGPLRRILDLMAQAGARGTFFVLGWVAARRPDLVLAIADAGHEIASHGWDHRRVTTQSPGEFRASVRQARDLLEQVIGRRVSGFRAPSYSITPSHEWALDVLLEEGYRYDSSLFPVRRPGGTYGYPGGPPDPHWIQRPSGRLAELPPAILEIGGWRIPAGGGGYFRIFPYAVVLAALRACERRGVPGTFYIHPWELDPGQPVLSVPWIVRLRHYWGLARTEARLERLLREFTFVSMAETVAAM